MLLITEIIPVLLLVIYVLGVAHAFDAVMRARTSQGAIAWVLSLVLIPYLAVPLYWIFGRSKFDEYVEMLREVQQSYHGALERIRSEFRPFSVRISKEALISQPLLERLVLLPFSRGNEVKVLKDGTTAFPEILKAISSAKSYVLLQSYILRDDTLGEELLEVLTNKASAGVRVYILLDSIGSFELSDSYEERLRAAGIKLEYFRAGKRGFLSRFQINFRNHRKTVIVDGAVGFLGGLNWGEEYLGQSREFGSWRDTHLRISGPALIPQQIAFNSDWLWASGENLAELTLNQATHQNDTQILIIPSGPSDLHETASLIFQHLISSAQDRIWIATPYFVPDMAVMTAIKTAILRGVEVRILIPHRRDHTLVYLANFGCTLEAALSGARIFRYERGFMHQKVMLVDDQISVVGSANFDNRSFRLNFELGALIVDRAIAAEIEEMLRNDFTCAHEFDVTTYQQRSFAFRATVQMARLFSPIL